MKTRVLHVSYGGLNHGGVCAVIFSIVETLYTRFDFGCVVFRTVGDREKSFEKYGRLHRLSCYRKDGRKSYFEEAVRPFRFFFGIYRICRKYDYQIIHTHNGDDEGICLLAAKAAGYRCELPIVIRRFHRKSCRFRKDCAPVLINCWWLDARLT